MNTYLTKSLLFLLTVMFTLSCKPKPAEKGNNNQKSSDFPYTLSVEVTEKKNAPSLQSFVHGVHGNDWLLFAGRTNSGSTDDGGLHSINKGNYANTSFLPPSFNEDIFVYNIDEDKTIKISLATLDSVLKAKYPKNYSVYKDYKAVFKNSNALVKQHGEYLYVLGGYGPVDLVNPGKQYETYKQVAKIHVPSLINIVKNKYEGVNSEKLFAFGKDKDSLLVSTGGELHTTGTGSSLKFYMAGGHNFNANQKYVDAVYPFTLTDSSHILKIKVKTAITDVIDPTLPLADDLSKFRRRDGPITPSLYKSPVKDQIEQGLAFYTGVFKPGEDLQAWNDAVYVHPNFANDEGKLFTIDKAYNQNNYNVYSCPSFVTYDSKTDISHTFLIGGIGDGNFADSGNLSGFTNTAVHIETNIGERPFRSTHQLIQPDDLFNQKDKNEPPFYGAEAILFVNDNVPLYAIATDKVTITTEILDMAAFEDTNIEVGYIFGGIEAFKSNPGTYGKTNSRASNKIWKVVLKKK